METTSNNQPGLPRSGSTRVLVWTIALLAMVFVTPMLASVPAWTAPISSSTTITTAAYDPDAANAPFPDLAVTVSQTKDLIAQGITLSWTGGRQSQIPTNQTGGQNFLQIAQCWGDEPGSNGTRPDRTTCQYGGFNMAGATRWWNRSSAEELLIPDEDLPYTVFGSGPNPTMTEIPFHSTTGDVVASVDNGVRVNTTVDVNNNEFFTRNTTNEVTWAGSGTDGTGSISFELQTAQEAPGLGCGTPVTKPDQSVVGASCWLVIIPRGSSDPFTSQITRSGLFQETWKHHLAIRLEFKPLGLRCAIGAAERQLSGSELVSQAVGQWQPSLCNSSNGMVFSMVTGPESDALKAATSAASSPLALTTRALTVEDDDPDPLTYAPIAVTGVSIGFSIDRYYGSNEVPPNVAARERHAFDSLKLTPRLLAKLLTASYQAALPNGSDKSHLGDNPRNLSYDPDFLAVNDPEWTYMMLNGVGLSDALVPLGRSDTARLVWDYIMADVNARAFMNGTPDPWGMTVNPYYSTNAAINPTGEALVIPAQDFPKADPVEFAGTANLNYADVVNLITWRPYTSSLDQVGYLVLRGDPQALGNFLTTTTPPKYERAARDLVGLQRVIGLTSTAAAARYQIVQASLLNPAGVFVAPTTQSLSAAAQAMVPDPNQEQVVGFDPESESARKATNAYPLTVPIYAATNPETDDLDVRADYAAFIEYAVTDGQQMGTDDGMLPPGYAPISSQWQSQALAAARTIKNGPPTEPTSTPTPTAEPTSTPTTVSTSPQPAVTSPVLESVEFPFEETPEIVLDPSATGVAAPDLFSGKTAADPEMGVMSAVVPTAGVAGLLATVCLPLVSRIRRLP